MPENISIRAPREGSDGGPAGSRRSLSYFYPRSPRGERHAVGAVICLLHWGFLSTLPARGATIEMAQIGKTKAISIHAPREGSDRSLARQSSSATDFYPRSPRGERRGVCGVHVCSLQFLSTLPARGATAAAWASRSTCCIFLSTLPARGATAGPARCKCGPPISIHAPREGSDVAAAVDPAGDRSKFLSTLPARGATLPHRQL